MNPEDVERFWSHVDKAPGQGPQGECWEWIGSKKSRGYGRFVIVRGKSGQPTTPAHRVAYLLSHGSIDDALMVLHSCDNKPCCNPAHLSQGTNSDNMLDMHAKGRGYIYPGKKPALTAEDIEQDQRARAAMVVAARALVKLWGRSAKVRKL